MELLFKNARDVKLIFRDDLEKGSEKNGSSLTLEVIRIFQILTLCLKTGERSEPEFFFFFFFFFFHCTFHTHIKWYFFLRKTYC